MNQERNTLTVLLTAKKQPHKAFLTTWITIIVTSSVKPEETEKTHRRKNRDYIILKKSQRSGKKEVMTGQLRQNILTRWPRAILTAMKIMKRFTTNMTKKERMQKVFRKRMTLSLIGTIIMVMSI